MWIRKIYICVHNVLKKNGEECASFTFNRGLNIISSQGINARGKTSLIRFIIWGLGFNISPTKSFDTSSSEVKLIIRNNPFIKTMYRSGYKLKITNRINKYKIYIIPKDTDKIIKLLMNGSINRCLYPNILGLFYLEQDQGLRTWNRGTVVQPLRQGDSAYKMKFKSILAGLKHVNYDKLNKEYNRLRLQSTNINRLINAINYFSSRSVGSSRFIEKKLRNRIAELNLKKQQASQNLKFYKNNNKNRVEFYKLLCLLNIRVKLENGDIVHVNTHNLVKDTIKHLELKYFIRYYKMILKDIYKKLRNINNRRKKIININNNSKYYIKIRKEVALSGIDVKDLNDAKNYIKHKKSNIKHKIKLSTDKNPYCNTTWNWAVKFLNNMGMHSNFISYRNNNLLTKKIPYSGSERELTIMSMRLSMYNSVMRCLNIKLPIIIDSPGNQEMNSATVNKFLYLIKSYFKSIQLIVATNISIPKSLDYHLINVTHGVFNDIYK